MLMLEYIHSESGTGISVEYQEPKYRLFSQFKSERWIKRGLILAALLYFFKHSVK